MTSIFFIVKNCIQIFENTGSFNSLHSITVEAKIADLEFEKYKRSLIPSQKNTNIKIDSKNTTSKISSWDPVKTKLSQGLLIKK